jgi:hypothetical protein
MESFICFWMVCNSPLFGRLFKAKKSEGPGDVCLLCALFLTLLLQ